MAPDKVPPHRPPRMIRIVRARPRLFLAAAIGIGVIVFSSSD